MVRSIQLLGSALAVVTNFAVVEAKTCDCRQHPATATGTGSCTLSESGTYCSISFYPASDAAEADQARMQFDAKKTELSKVESFETIDPLHAFERLYLNKLDVTAAELTTAALAAVPLQYVNEVAEPFARLFGKDSPRLPELVDTFNRLQCVEAQEGTFRVLILSVNSAQNSRCTP